MALVWYWEISFVNFIRLLDILSHARQIRHCPKCHASVHQSQKKRSRSLLQKSSILLANFAMAPCPPKPGVAALPKSLCTPQIPSQDTRRVYRIDLGGGDSLAGTGTTLPGVQADLLAGNSNIGLLDDLLSLGEDELDVAGVGHVWVDLEWMSVSGFTRLPLSRSCCL